jgi:ribose transport system substrate-binding protein
MPFTARRRRPPGAWLVAALALLLGGACSSSSKDEGRFVVGFAQVESDDPWRAAQTQSLRDEAARRGIDLLVTDAQGQTAKQLSDVEDLIAREVSVILLAPREYAGLAPALASAREAGIPVILLDREAAGRPGQDYVTFVGSNFAEQGRRAAEWLVRETNGDAQIVELSGTTGASVSADRARGFREGIAGHPKMRIIASRSGDFSRATGQQVLQEIAQTRGAQITAVYAHNDEMALGAIQALIGAGRRPGQDVKLVSIDGERAALEAIEQGDLGATVESSPHFGPVAFEVIAKVRRGEPVPPRIVLTDRFFDKSNASRFKADAY